MTSHKLESNWQKAHNERVAKMPVPIRDAHTHCRRNVTELSASDACGCFYCLQIFAPLEIDDWTEDESALCPKCGVDSVIGSAAGFPLTHVFLAEMKSYWF